MQPQRISPVKRREVCKKIAEIYHNYGIDTSNMEDSEIDNIVEMYISMGRDIDADLRESEKHKDKFGEDLI